MARMAIKVNGQVRIATDWFSCGPDTRIHTYNLKGGREYVTSFGWSNTGIKWMLHADGEFPREVTVESVEE